MGQSNSLETRKLPEWKELYDSYPFNLALDILGSDEEARKIYIPGIPAALATLTEREADILRKRYSDRMTLKAIGQIYGVGRERIRQIIAKALRKLRRPTRANTFMAVSVSELRKLEVEYQKLSRLLAEAFNELSEYKAKLAEPGGEIPTEELAMIMQTPEELAMTTQTPIEDLDLSVRSYNCLKRAGKRTLRDIAEMTMGELLRIRGLGIKSAKEIVNCLKCYGLDLRHG